MRTFINYVKNYRAQNNKALYIKQQLGLKAKLNKNKLTAEFLSAIGLTFGIQSIKLTKNLKKIILK